MSFQCLSEKPLPLRWGLLSCVERQGNGGFSPMYAGLPVQVCAALGGTLQERVRMIGTNLTQPVAESFSHCVDGPNEKQYVEAAQGRAWKPYPAPNRNGSSKDHAMAHAALPSPEVLRQLLRYEPDTGKLFWRERPAAMFPAGSAGSWNERCAGKEAFTARDGHGYRCGKVFNRLYLAHRIIWAMQTGEWPSTDVDHRNGNHTDNRWSNLRSATHGQNMRNRRSAAGSSSQYMGVTMVTPGRWRARIRVAGRLKDLGRFADETEAAFAYDAAAIRAFGDFARPNFTPTPAASSAGEQETG